MPKGNIKKNTEKLRRILKDSGTVLHFVGIGGVSMSSLARIATECGIRVTGSDKYIGETVRKLRKMGITVYEGHDSSHIRGASAVIYSHAIPPDNPELIRAAHRGTLTLSRAELLGTVMNDYQKRIGVCGTHGKSTTVAMLDLILHAQGMEPTVISGAKLTTGDSLRMGGKDLLLYEACEYKDSFLHFSPNVAVALNIELDHVDYFKDLASLKNSFRKAIGKATDFAVLNDDDRYLPIIRHEIGCRTVGFGMGERADYRYSIQSFLDEGFRFSLFGQNGAKHQFTLRTPGVHNVINATAAIVTALELGVSPNVAADALAEFHGIERRLEHIGNRHGRPVYYDYAHHPTEIIAGINALRMRTRDNITVIFKPHTYSRTKVLWDDFVSAFSLADHVILTDVYPAREEPVAGVDSASLAAAIGSHAIYSADYDVAYHTDMSTHGAIVIMGAGNMDAVLDSVFKH